MKAIQKFNEEKLNDASSWFNSLDNNIQLEINEWLSDKRDELSLSSQDSSNLDNLVETTRDLIVSTNNDLSMVEDALNKQQLDKLVIKSLVAFCLPLARPFIDAKIISKLTKSNLQKTCNFIMNHTIICNDFMHSEPEDFLKLTGLSDGESTKVFSFLRYHYQKVARREISTASLADLLKSQFLISPQKVEVILEPIKNNELNMSISQLFREIDAINKTLLDLTTFNNFSDSD